MTDQIYTTQLRRALRNCLTLWDSQYSAMADDAERTVWEAAKDVLFEMVRYDCHSGFGKPIACFYVLHTYEGDIMYSNAGYCPQLEQFITRIKELSVGGMAEIDKKYKDCEVDIDDLIVTVHRGFIK